MGDHMNKASWKEKWENYWYYYKIHTWVGLFILISVGYMVLTTPHNKPTALSVTFIGPVMQSNLQKQFQDAATAAVLHNPNAKSQVSISFWPMAGTLANPSNVALAEKLTAMTATQGLDVVVMDQTDFAAFAKQGSFMNLKSLLANFPTSTLHFFKAKPTGKNQTEKLGIKLAGNPLLKSLGLQTNNEILGVMVNTRHASLSKGFIQWLFKLS